MPVEDADEGTDVDADDDLTRVVDADVDADNDDPDVDDDPEVEETNNVLLLEEADVENPDVLGITKTFFCLINKSLLNPILLGWVVPVPVVVILFVGPIV